MFALWKNSYDQHRQDSKKQRLYFANKIPCSQSCGFSNIHVSMWELDYKESWALKNRCFLTVVLEKTFFFFFYSDQIREFNNNKIQSIFHSQILSAASIISFVAIFCFPQSRIQYRKHNAFPFIFMALFYFIKKNFFSFIYISWRIITLQYCSGFCHTLIWISHGFTCFPHPDPPSHHPPIASPGSS